MKPIRPEEVTFELPSDIIAVINDMIANILDNMDYVRNDLFANNYLDIICTGWMGSNL